MCAVNRFVYVVCGSEQHIKTLHVSMNYLKNFTKNEIIVVTDKTRNQIPVIHDQIIDVRIDPFYDHHQASILIKTNLHRILNMQHTYCYLDCDVIPLNSKVDNIFDYRYGKVNFAKDYAFIGSNIKRFSPWAVNCSCTGKGDTATCSHLLDAIEQTYKIKIPGDWVQWNGGVFLFDKKSSDFMNLWHRIILEIFEDSYWRTRDQGALIITIWKFGLQDQVCLPADFNFLVDKFNTALQYDEREGFSIHPTIPKIKPTFIHLCNSDLSIEDFDYKQEINTIVRKFG